MLDTKNLITLAKMTANADPHAATSYSFGEDKFSYADLNETLRSELKELAGDYKSYRANKQTIFTLFEEVIDDVLPKKVLDAYGQFAEIKTYAQGDKPIFHQRITNASKRRAKQFVTKVGLAGIYEVFKLDGKSVEVTTGAYGGAAQIALEEFLDGRFQMADYLDLVMEALDEAVYKEIAKALIKDINTLPGNNIGTSTAFDEDVLDKLVQIADVYGQSAIYCTYEFATKIIPQDKWISENMKDTRLAQGYLANYKGHRVIILPQSFDDVDNEKRVINPAYAWIIPTGSDKPVKIAFEGNAQVKEFENRDWSTEIHTYVKFGVATMFTNDICVYHITSLDALPHVEY